MIQNISLISPQWSRSPLYMVSFFPRKIIDSISCDGSSNGLIKFCKGLFFGRWLVGIFLSLGEHLEMLIMAYPNFPFHFVMSFMISIFDTVEATSCTCHIVIMGMVLSNKSYMYSIYRIECHTVLWEVPCSAAPTTQRTISIYTYVFHICVAREMLNTHRYSDAVEKYRFMYI